MSRQFVLVAAAVLAGQHPSSAEPIQTENSPRPLPLRLAEPEVRVLSGDEIRTRISDRSVIVDEKYEPAPGIKIKVSYWGGCPPYETFFANGGWQMGECSVAYRIYEGRWTIEPFRGGEWLCVEAVDHPKACRFVWPGSTASQIVMQQPMTGDEFKDRNRRFANPFNPYQITLPKYGMHKSNDPTGLQRQLPRPAGILLSNPAE